MIGFGLVHVQIHYGFGRPQYYLTKWELIEFRKYAFGEWIQTFATLMWTKVSICLFLRRIPITKALLRPLDVAIVFLIVSNVIITILWIVQCKPVDAAWNSNLKGACFSRGQLERIVLAQAGRSTQIDSARHCRVSFEVLLKYGCQSSLRLQTSPLQLTLSLSCGKFK